MHLAKRAEDSKNLGALGAIDLILFDILKCGCRSRSKYCKLLPMLALVRSEDCPKVGERSNIGAEEVVEKEFLQ